MAILSSYRFIQHTSFPAVINRILSQIRGIGSPLVSMYARTYLARKGYEVEPFLKDYLIKSFYDYLEVTQRYEKSKLENELKILHINYSEYLNLFSPALDWQLQCIGVNANQVKIINFSFFYNLTQQNIRNYFKKFLVNIKKLKIHTF